MRLRSMTPNAPGLPGIARGGCTCARATMVCAVSTSPSWIQRRRCAATAAAAVARAGAAEVDLLYWTAVSWAAAIALGKDDPSLVADLPLVSALIDRALAVARDWDRGAIHSFLITYEMVRPDASEDRDRSPARDAFRPCRRLVAGQGCGSVCVLGRVRVPAAGGSRLLRGDARGGARRSIPTTIRRRDWPTPYASAAPPGCWRHVDRWILPPLDDAAGQEEKR